MMAPNISVKSIFDNSTEQLTKWCRLPDLESKILLKEAWLLALQKKLK